MKTDAFRSWLAENFLPSTASTQMSSAKRVEDAYGDLDELYDAESLEQLARSFDYSTADARASKPNPTKLVIAGKLDTNLASYKSAIRCYARFRDQGSNIASEVLVETAAAAIIERRQGKLFELEAHLQEALRSELNQLQPGLEIADGGSERSVASGQIDILSRDANGDLVVIELKRGLARRETVGQVMGYVGDIMDEEPDVPVRAIIIASEFDQACVSAARAIPNLLLFRYGFEFTFSPLQSGAGRRK